MKIKADRLAVEAMLNTNHRAAVGADIEVRIKRSANSSGAAVDGYRVNRLRRTQGPDGVWEEIAHSSRTDWFARMPSAVGAAILLVEDSTPGYIGSIGGSYDSQVNPDRHEKAKAALRQAVAEWPE